jgi:hypothetical protein
MPGSLLPRQHGEPSVSSSAGASGGTFCREERWRGSRDRDGEREVEMRQRQ